MKKYIFYTFIAIATFFLSTNPLFSQIQTIKHLTYALANADTYLSIKFADDFATSHPQMTKSILLLPLNDPSSTSFGGALFRAKKNGFNCFKASSRMGLISKEEFFDVAFTLIADIDRYHNEYGRESALAWYCGGVAHYGLGNVIKDDNFSDLILMLNTLQNNNHFRNKGFKKSIEQKLSNAFKAFKKGNEKAAKNILNATKNEIEAQSSKGINQHIALTLESYIENLIEGIEKQ